MIAIGADHAGVFLKDSLKKFIEEKGYEVKDFGTFTDESCDYPVYAKAVSEAVASKEAEKGILVCGTGIGMSMAANKVDGIRAAVCTDPKSTEFTRRHNDANVLCLGARIIDEETAKKLVEIYLTTEFEGGKHLKRISMFS